MSGFSRPLCSPTHPGLDPVAVKETRSIPRAIARALQWALGASLVTAACFVAPGTSHADSSAKFIPAKPTEKSQTQKSVEERGGINPCNTKEPKPGVYLPWNRGPSIGQMIMPARGGVTKDGKFDVVIHFHGHDPIRREFVQVMDGAVLVGITLVELGLIGSRRMPSMAAIKSGERTIHNPTSAPRPTPCPASCTWTSAATTWPT